jgi:hypothetical protein
VIPSDCVTKLPKHSAKWGLPCGDTTKDCRASPDPQPRPLVRSAPTLRLLLFLTPMKIEGKRKPLIIAINGILG